MTTTYRAAYWLSADRQGQLVLTSPEQSHLSDEELMAAALREAEENGLDVSKGDIHIGEWKE